MGRQSKVQQMLGEGKEYFKQYENDETRRTFFESFRRFIKYCREIHGCKTAEACKSHVQNYADWLVSRNLSASTVHTYLSGVCLFYGIPMNNISKPKRYISYYKRGRSFNGRTERGNNNIDNPKFTKTVEFQRVVGIRRRELANLRKEDFVLDESGQPCVLVRKGKGGKKHRQRILLSDVPFVRSYFDSVSEGEKLFTKEDLKNEISYHSLRAAQARRAYEFYLKMASTPSGRAELERQVRARWNLCNLKRGEKTARPLPNKLIYGTYFLRGKTKTFAKEHGLPTQYDKLCTLAVSIFHLAHFRNDVTVQSYFLAI